MAALFVLSTSLAVAALGAMTLADESTDPGWNDCAFGVPLPFQDPLVVSATPSQLIHANTFQLRRRRNSLQS